MSGHACRVPGSPATSRDASIHLHAMDEDSLAGREPHVDRIGISYMYAARGCRINRPKATGQRAASFTWVRTSWL